LACIFFLNKNGRLRRSDETVYQRGEEIAILSAKSFVCEAALATVTWDQEDNLMDVGHRSWAW
jgi:hypothetical protein